MKKNQLCSSMKVTTSKYLILLYDNTLNGLLSAIFDAYRLKLDHFDIIAKQDFHEQLFKPTLQVSTNKAKANRIKIGLKRKTGQNLLPYLQTSFNSQIRKEEKIYQFVQNIFNQKSS